MANLQISFPNYFVDVDGIPVRVDIRDVELDLLKTEYVQFGDSTYISLDPGIYVVEAELPSGSRMHEVVRLGEDPEPLVMKTQDLSPHENHAWAYMNKNARQVPTRSLNQTQYEGAWVQLWRKEDAWKTVESEFGGSSMWDADGVYYDLESYGGAQVLQVGGPGVPWKCVALPGALSLRVLIRPAAGPEGEVHPLDVIVSTHDTGAEAILSLLDTGAVEDAKVIENAGAAEQMLYQKIANPSGAAIGGYYLLKSGDLDRLHDWTLNLADWIDWMADGPVIRAWHVLKDARLHGKDRAETYAKAREFLLKAVDRGIPVYTEGLRLLRDGINALSQNKDDAEAQAAKAIVDRYTESCDWSAPTTTFLGVRPDQPSPEPVVGEAESMDHLVYLYNVETEELIRQGVLNVGSTVMLKRSEDEPVEVFVEEGGELNLGGTRYKRLQDVARSVGLPDTELYEWESGDTGKSIYEGISHLRHGKFTVYGK